MWIALFAPTVLQFVPSGTFAPESFQIVPARFTFAPVFWNIKEKFEIIGLNTEQFAAMK